MKPATAASPTTLPQSDADWTHWAATEPYYAVLTDDSFRRASLSDSRAAFFATGERHIAWLLQAAGIDLAAAAGQHALDHGCGVGRLTIPLARRFAAVTGCDVAADMLAEAQRNCVAQGIGNVDFMLWPEDAAVIATEYALIQSLYVFQHIPAARGLAILTGLAGCLAVGGVLAVHLTTRRNFTAAKELDYRLRAWSPRLNRLANFATGRGAEERMMLATEYDLPHVIALLARQGCSEFGILCSDDGPISSVILSCRRGLHPGRFGCPSFPDP